jgi:hypothetical protein
MNTESTILIYGLSNARIAYCEAQGLSKCFAAYANCSGATIESIGFNSNSGYVYISLENGVQICSMLGQDVDYIVTDYDTGEDVCLDDYDTAVNYEFEAV